MGSLTFLLPDGPSPAADRCLERACLAGGYELTPLPTRRHRDDKQLTLSKDVHESGYLTAGWPLPGLGCPVTTTATLRERPEPYHLLTELARGKLNQVRNQTAEWEAIGLTVDPGLRADLSEAIRLFGTAALDPGAPAADPAAADALARAYRVGEQIARQFTEQLLRARLAEVRKGADADRLPTLLGCRLSRLPAAADRAAFLDSYNAVRLAPDWHLIEPREAGYDWDRFDALVDWAVETGRQVSVGPVVDLDPARMPAWMRQWAGDLPSLSAFVCDFVETTVRRYSDRVSRWQVFAGFNHADVYGLGADDRLRLAARLMDSARQAHPGGEWVIGVSQPWGDYLEAGTHPYSPLVFADMLMRAGYTFGVELELACGGSPRASRPRDVLDVYRLLELFNLLQLPLEVAVLTQPPGPAAEAAGWPPGWAASILALATAMPQVRAAYWDFGDAAAVPGGGPAAVGGSEIPFVVRHLRDQFLV